MRKSVRASRSNVSAPDLSERTWWMGAALALAVASLLRLYKLPLKPLHHDEGVNGLFLSGLVHQGIYRYDPENYHGPTLYYLGLLVARVNGLLFHSDGLSDATIRLVPALFGIATVGLLLCLRNELGKPGALVAATLAAVSPGAVYYSRYFIHETLFVFFTLCVVMCGLLTYRRRNPVYLLAGAGAAGLLCATKETAWMTLVVLAIAAGVQYALQRFRGLAPIPLADGWRSLRYALLSMLLFAAIFATLYSSFFENPQGVRDALRSLTIWTRTGITQAYHPWYLYLKFLVREEWLTLVLGLAGVAVAMSRARGGLGLFAGIWAFGLLAAYTLIPYKTPWLMLNFTIPLAIAAGCSAALWTKARAALVIIALAASLTHTVNLNFEHYDDEAEPYVYVHTTRQIFDLLDVIEQAAMRTGAGNRLEVSVTSSEYWPLPWYLRDYTQVGYWGREVVTTEAVVIGSQEQDASLQASLNQAYRRFGSYVLRPGVTVVIFVRKDIPIMAGDVQTHGN